MIAKLTGRIDVIKPTEVILDVGGVGYQLAIPVSTYEKISGADEITLHVHTHHKEDQFRLFGFITENEKNLFSMLLKVSGIGPAMGLSMLSGIQIEQLIGAVKDNNPSVLTKIPGIGKSKAEKLVFELRRKIKKIEELGIDSPKKSKIGDEALEALLSLGFDEKKSTQVIDSLIHENPDISIEKLVKNAIKLLST